MIHYRNAKELPIEYVVDYDGTLVQTVNYDGDDQEPLRLGDFLVTGAEVFPEHEGQNWHGSTFLTYGSGYVIRMSDCGEFAKVAYFYETTEQNNG